MGVIASQITSLTIVYSNVYSSADQRKHQSSASLAFVLGIHRWPVNSPHKWPVTWKMFPFDDVIMVKISTQSHGCLIITVPSYQCRNLHHDILALYWNFPWYFPQLWWRWNPAPLSGFYDARGHHLGPAVCSIRIAWRHEAPDLVRLRCLWKYNPLWRGRDNIWGTPYQHIKMLNLYILIPPAPLRNTFKALLIYFCGPFY